MADEASTPNGEGDGGEARPKYGTLYDVVGEDGQVVMRTNQNIIDDANSQVLSMQEIEKLKASNEGSGKDLVKKILESHQAIDQKTAYALAKYTLRKTKKYVKRFTVIPLDVAFLASWTLHEKYASKIMEIREETLGLIRSWSNIHLTPEGQNHDRQPSPDVSKGRWLVVDDTAGLLTAYLAEQMGFLGETAPQQSTQANTQSNGEAGDVDGEADAVNGSKEQGDDQDRPMTTNPTRSYGHMPPLSSSNTITVIHPLSQPNLSYLRYFSYDVFDPSPSHPLTPHLRTLSWLQLLDPDSSNIYQPPPEISKEELASYKSAKRSSHYRKLRRYNRTKEIIDSTRAGGFDGLIVASVMKPADILHHLVPLLRGSAQIVMYSAHLEPLAEVADLYSTARRTGFLNNPVDVPCEDFPVDPRLVLAPTIWSVRAKPWQVLPGRTHPLMTGRGGADGYVFTGTRVLPAEGVTARGNYTKRRKVEVVNVNGEAINAKAVEIK